MECMYDMYAMYLSNMMYSMCVTHIYYIYMYVSMYVYIYIFTVFTYSKYQPHKWCFCARPGQFAEQVN
jgi:hypothetical protein